MTDDREQSSNESDWNYAGNRCRQLRAGLAMTSAERLEWLEEMLDELLPLVGRAREAGKAGERSRR